MHRQSLWVTALASMLPAGSPALAGGFIISDRALFDRIPHTLIDFETLADGTPLIVPEGGDIPMRFGEYSTLGVLIFGAPNWVNFSSDDLEAIQAEHASPHNSLAMGAVFPGDPVGIGFLTSRTVRAFSLFVMMDVSTPQPRPEFDIFAGDTYFTTIVFDETLVQGRVGDIEYGFVGYASDDPFDAVVMRNFTRPAFDDLRFSAIPAPGPTAVMGLGALGVAIRRRRNH